MGVPWGTITGIRVQDPWRQIWFNWDNPTKIRGAGSWDALPQIEAWGGCYLSAWATNNDVASHTMTLKIIESGSVLVQKVETVASNQGFGVEWSGAFVPPAARPITVELWIDNWIEDSVVFDLGVYNAPIPEPEPEPEPEPTPPARKLCLLTAVGLPAFALSWLRVAVRPRLPFWFVKNYYRLSMFLLAVG